MAFLRAEYEVLLKNLLRSGRSFRTVAHFLADPDKKSIILRHDVDRWITRSVAVARLEYENNITASYYFRYRNGFPINAIREIDAMGHEVGYHYETFSNSKGKRCIARKMFLEQLDAFRLIAECHTICAHGRPLSKWFSGDMANIFLEVADDLTGDASESMPSELVLYLTDAGGRWNDKTVNLRDKVGVMPLGIDPLDINSLAQIFHQERSLYINTHPERWCGSVIELVPQNLSEFAVGAVKKLLRSFRGE